MPDNTWEMIGKRMVDLGPLYDKMDITKNRLYLTPYSLTDFDGKTPIDDAINVTENKSATFVTRIIAGLMSSRWQTVIEGEISKREAHTIETFIDDNLAQADEYILNQWGLAGLQTWLSSHVCTRGLIGVEWTLQIVDGEYKIHCLPLDMRYTPYVLNKWAAPITFRTKADLEQEFERYEKLGGFKKPEKLQDTGNEVRNYWDKEVNELWVNKEKVFEQRNPFGKPPFVIVSPPTGFMLRDTGYLEHESPSLLFLNEGLYEQLSRQLSIDATLGFESLFPSYEYEVENMDDKPSEPTPRLGETSKRRRGELHKPVPRGDLNIAARTSREEILKMVDEATPVSPRSYTQPPSALQVMTEVELLNQLQSPRIIALQMFREQLIRLMIEQFVSIQQDGSVQVGKMGKRKSYSVGQLKDPGKYSVSCQLMTKNKRLEIVNEARYLAMRGKAPLKYILKDVLMVEDPDGWIREMELEEARKADPSVALFEMAVRHAEEAEDTEDPNHAELLKFQSMILVDRGVAIVKQRMVAPLPEEQIPQVEKGSPRGLIELLGPGGSSPMEEVL